MSPLSAPTTLVLFKPDHLKAPEFNAYSREDLSSLVHPRAGETKWGEVISVPGNDVDRFLETSTARFVILGIPEDIGVRGNLGIGGAHSGWNIFLRVLLNLPVNRFLSLENVALLGHVDASKLNKNLPETTQPSAEELAQLREATAVLDEAVTTIASQVMRAGKIPIVIGGGHNNSYPLIRAASQVFGQAINAINCDPHADFRALEGRHSGNGFSYAMHEGHLHKYALLGLHENYNSEPLLAHLDQFAQQIQLSTYDDIFIRHSKTWETAIREALDFVQGPPVGIELDLDSIAYVPVSAQTPSGLSVREARQYVTACGIHSNVAYLHLCEAAPELSTRPQALTGKVLSYLTTDLMKAVG